MQITVTQKRPKSNVPSGLLIFLLVLGAAYTFYVYQMNMIQMIWVGPVICVVALAGFVRSQFNPRVLLSIDEYGIFDNRLGVGKIPWTDIEETQLQLIGEKEYLCLRMKDPERYLNDVNQSKRKKVALNQRLGFTGLNVDVSACDMNPVDLKKLIDARLTRS